mmetsp:Transcript_90225/g.200477  ORF Transcript_90225/g.200477 Transcript_90225/m.200477 type:complete len:554 (-) Transcript_90225:224-1885(-)
MRQSTHRKVLHVDVGVLVQVFEGWFDDGVDVLCVDVMVLQHPSDGAACAKPNVGHVVLGRLDQQGDDVLHDLLWGHHARHLRQDVQSGDATGIAHTMRVLLHDLRQEMLDRPHRTESGGDGLEVNDRGLTNGVHRVAEARDKESLKLRLEHFDSEQLRQPWNLLDDTLANSPMVVHDEALDGVEQRVHQTLHTENFADEPRVRNDVQSDIMELILDQVLDQAEQVALGQVLPGHFGNSSDDLRKSRAHGLCWVCAQGGEGWEDVLLHDGAGQDVRELQQGLDSLHRLFAHLLLIILEERDKTGQEHLCRELGTISSDQLVKDLADREPHSPRAVLNRILDHRNRMHLVLFSTEHASDNHCRVHARNPDDILRVLLRKSLVERDHVCQKVRLITNGHKVPHLQCRRSPYHRCVVTAKSGVHLPQPRLLVLVCIPIGSRQQRASGDTSREEISLRHQPLHHRHKILRGKAWSLLDNRAEGQHRLVPYHCLFLRRQVFKGRHEELVATIDVIATTEHRILLRHAEKELFIAAERLLLNHLDHKRDELAHRFLGSKS